MFRLPDYLLKALKSFCFVDLCTPRTPEFSKGLIEVQELVDLGYLATRIVDRKQRRRRGEAIVKVDQTSITPKGKRVLSANLHPSELVALIQQGAASGYLRPAAELVIGVSKTFLPELLSSSSICVREAARERLDKLNGLERRTN